MKKLIAVLIVSLVATNAFAGYSYWNGGTGAFEDAANWNTTTAPAFLDGFIVDSTNSHATISTAYYTNWTTERAYDVSIGDWRSNNVLEVTTGGQLWAGFFYDGALQQGNGWFTLGNNGTTQFGTGEGELLISGGYAVIGQHLVVGNSGIGKITMTSGNLFVQFGSVWLPIGGGSGTIDLDGGVMTVDTAINFGANGVVNITEGTLRMWGDYTGSANLTNGNILGYGSADNLVATYTPGGYTTITAIPEPATLAILGMGFVGTLLRRKSK